MVVRRVGVFSAGKVMGAFGVFIGLLIGGFMALFAMLGTAVQIQGAQNAPASQLPAMAMGVGALIFAPVFYGVFCFISGIIYAAIYNLVAGVVGGLELDLQPG